MSESYHFIGIGGIGMSSLAKILLGKNLPVSGSDLSENSMTEQLKLAGAKIYKGHSPTHVASGMKVIYSSDIKNENPEFQAALQLGCRLMHRSELLAELSQEKRSLAVAGTHGKTTTSALLACVLEQAGTDPSFSIGGVLPRFKSNARHGQGNLFAFEADESDGTFLKYRPFGAIVTNIDNDHLINFGGSEENLITAFGIFLDQVLSPSHLFWCGDDLHLAKLNRPGESYGFGSECKWRISNFQQSGFSFTIDIEGAGQVYRNIEVALTGKHNALNATAVFGLARVLGIEEEPIREALRTFQGVVRRCQRKGTHHGIDFIDDYAHHPTEIQATLKAVRGAIEERRLIVIFQPHRYTRTKDCLGQFGTVFEEADEVIITDIYSAGESPIEGIEAAAIVKEIKTASSIPSQYIARGELAKKVANQLLPHDVVLTLGAGDITKVYEEILKHLPQLKHRVGLIFGGKSSEHEISLRSAQHFIDSLNSQYYDICHFGITKQGGWITGQDSKARLEKGEFGLSLTSEVMEHLSKCDVLIPVLHGPNGEDGTIQGFFEMIGKAYVGCDHRSAAISMNKVYSKELAASQGIRIAPYVECRKWEWEQNPDAFIKKVVAKLPFPVFVKPAHLGSSIGVVKVSSPSDLQKALKEAFLFDTHVLVEQGINNCREIEFAVLGNETIKVFPPGEILTHGQVYDYQAKYGSNGFGVVPNADLDPVLIEQGCELALKAYKAIGACGMARVDFFLDEQGKYWFNELNPIPGFTSISLYPLICSHNGLKSSELMDRLICLALSRKRRQERCKSTYD